MRWFVKCFHRPDQAILMPSRQFKAPLPASRTTIWPGTLVRLIHPFRHSRALQRRALSELDDRLLDDIGVDRRSARLEAVKRFWQD